MSYLLKGLTRSMALMLPKSCGHVVCVTCWSNGSGKECLVCNEDASKVIKLQSEGTGYTAGSSNIYIVKDDIAFQ